MADKGKFYMTTAIAYTSGKPHIGNTYEAVLADSITRDRRLRGYDVFMQTGTDEHGQKIEEKAKNSNKTPQEFVDGVAEEIQAIWDLMGVKYDKFVRTTDKAHERKVQQIFKKLYDQGDIYKGKYEGLYCTPCESFWTESQLKDGKCPDCGREVHKEYEEAYFFKMSKYAQRLIDHINSHPDFIRPVSRKNEMMNNFLLPGLQDLCVSRTSFKWGIPLDFDPKHVVYVWLDALTNYITNIGYEVDGNNEPLFDKLWPAELHLVGKDIIRFHTIYWPIFLMALDLPLPKTVYGHPWLLQGDGKMSKSRGNVMYADDLVDLFGLDAIRYFLLHEMSFDNDGTITYELITERINSDLANTLGNLVNRTIAMTNKYFDGKIKSNSATTDFDEDLFSTINTALDKHEELMESYHVADALDKNMSIFKRLNKYIDETEPWVLAKDSNKKDVLENVLHNLVLGIIKGATILSSYIPDTTEKIFSQLGIEMPDYDSIRNNNLINEIEVTKTPTILFERLVLDDVMAKVAEKFPENSTNEKKDLDGAEDKSDIEYEEIKSEVNFDDFMKLDIRVGKVLSCERVPKSKKLLCSQIDIGTEVRQILSGIYPTYTPEDMVGREVCVLVNLAPRKMAGLESQGMVMCAEDAKTGKLVLVSPNKDVTSGSIVG